MNILALLITLLSLNATPTDAVTTELLQNRTSDNLIIEYCEGIILDEDGNGKITNTAEPFYNYINYSYIENVRPGETITTYFIYNPLTQYEDDIILRIDVTEDGNVWTR